MSSHCASKENTKISEPVKVSACKIKEEGKKVGLHSTQKWQDEFFEALCESQASEGWGLFQEGGFTGAGDFGQVFVIPEGANAKVYALTFRDKDLQSHELNKDRFKKFKNSVQTNSTNLKEHWSNGFDMMEYEFVHVEKNGDELSVKQRVKWRFGLEKCEAHCHLSDAFKKLLKH
jgi:hypothetical protein